MRTGSLLRLAGGITTIAVTGLSIAPAAHAAGTRVVHAGESIQKAVDTAKPGDTILIEAGTYHESVLINKNGLTISGAGDQTVISPAASASQNSCGQAGNGICVSGTPEKKIADVTIQALTVSGFSKSGILGSQTDRMTVRSVLAKNNGEYGIEQLNSTRGMLRNNEAKENGRSGIFLANVSDAQNATISGNHASGNPTGISVHSASKLTVEDNVVTGNCGGLYVLDGREPHSKSVTIRRNVVYGNNKSCAAKGRSPYSKGSGIVLVGVEGSTVDGNLVWNNKGDARQSGGIVLSKSFDSGHASSGNVISNNVARDNKPGDLLNLDAAAGNQGAMAGGAAANQFTDNTCQSAVPADLC